MELYKTQIGKVLEQLKVALLSNIPIAYMPTNDLNFINELLFSSETDGALIPRLWNKNDQLVLLKPNQYFTKSATGGEAYITDNYVITSKMPKRMRVPSLIVLTIDDWKDAEGLREYLNIYNNIKQNQTYNQVDVVDVVRRSICIVVTPKRLPVPEDLAPYIKKIDIPALSDEEIRETITSSLREAECDPKILGEDLLKDFVESLRGFGKSIIRRILSEIVAKQLVDPNPIVGGIDEKTKEQILESIRAEKRAMMEDTPGLKWEKVGNKKAAGLKNLEEWIYDHKDVFDSKNAADRYTDIPKGLLISGIPGSGKSLMAKTTASILKLPLISLDMGDLLGGLMGQSEHNMINALHMAEQMAPCVLWIDEIEKAFSGSSQSSSGDSGVGRRMFGKFLTWMQEKSSACFVFATSNDITVLPPELFRSERFDKKYFAFMPIAEECAAIFSGIIKKENHDYCEGIKSLPASKRALMPRLLFDKAVEEPIYWINLINRYCAPPDASLTLQEIESKQEDSSDLRGKKYGWEDNIKPNFKLLTGADISALIKELKFRLYKRQFEAPSDAPCVYREDVVQNMARYILTSADFKPYGETNVLDIVRCYYRLYINQFVPASGQCILDFSKYSDEDNCYYHTPGLEPQNRYDRALYYLLVGAINYYGHKIKLKS